jgi:alpha-ketoglutarate-dependent taurine dioxygenase
MPIQSSLSASFGVILEPSGPETLDELRTDHVIEALRGHGALLFRGFSPALEEFGAFTARFIQSFMVHPDPSRLDRTPDRTTQTVEAGKHAISLHQELAFIPVRPDLVCFHCLVPAERGGETTLGDGLAIWRRLSPHARARFEAQRLRYGLMVPPPVLRHNAGFVELALKAMGLPIRLDAEGNLHSEYFAPAATPPRFSGEPAFVNSVLPYANNEVKNSRTTTFEDGSPLSADLLAEVRGVADELTVPVRWQPGDFVMIDNSRVMHGRTAWDGAARDLNIRMGMTGPLT